MLRRGKLFRCLSHWVARDPRFGRRAVSWPAFGPKVSVVSESLLSWVNGCCERSGLVSTVDILPVICRLKLYPSDLANRIVDKLDMPIAEC